MAAALTGGLAIALDLATLALVAADVEGRVSNHISGKQEESKLKARGGMKVLLDVIRRGQGDHTMLSKCTTSELRLANMS